MVITAGQTGKLTTKYVTKYVTRKVSVLKGVISEFVRYVAMETPDGKVVTVPKVVKAVTMPAGKGRHKAFAANIREYYGIVRKVMERAV